MNKTSICIPTYNGAVFVEQALQSIVNQTTHEIEIIVSDDNSTDDTLACVKRIDDRRLCWVSNRSRLGLVGNWNRCLELASHELICLFHQDDEMLPTNIAEKVNLLERHPEVGFVFSNMLSIDATGAIVGQHWNPRDLPESDTIISGIEFFRKQLQHGNLVSCPTVMARRDLLQRFGGFHSQLQFTPDLHMWLQLSLYADVAYLATPLVKVRRHHDQESNRFLGNVNEIKEVRRAIDLVFAEHRARVPNADQLYQVALSHLRRWTVVRLHTALRKGRMRPAIAHAVLLGKLA